MDAIRSVIQRLESSPTVKKAQKTDQGVQDAMSQLSSVAALLALSSLSQGMLIKLTGFLRRRLLPLYRISSTLTLDYALSVFCFIHQNKLLQNKAEETRRPWEHLLESLFSGILDFLEDNPTGPFHFVSSIKVSESELYILGKVRDNIASALYPVLCPVFFFGPQGCNEEFDGNLLSTVYQLLLTTVESNPKNGLKLRDTHIGSVNFGSTIYRTKDFLAMESLLDLFALLIPPLKVGRDKRTRFITEVFDPSVFSCSDPIIRCLENISDPDWSITSAKIMNALASSDVSFPQPLEVAAFALNGERMNVSSFFVDKVKFVANIDMDGRIETLHIPFSMIRKISQTPSSNNVARIVASATEPPIMGDTPIQNIVEGDQMISWDIERKLLERFRNAVISRGLNLESSARTKQSKAEEISLDFQPTKQAEKKTPSTWKKDKIESLSQLWNAGAPTYEDQATVLVTSPLVPGHEVKSILKANITALDRPDLLENRKSDSVFVHPDGNLSFEPKAHVVIPSMTDSPDKKTELQTDDLSEDNEVLLSRPKFSSKKRVISLTDDEDEDEHSGSIVDLDRPSLTTIEEPPPQLPKDSETPSMGAELVESAGSKPQIKKSKTVHLPKETSHVKGERKVSDNTKKRHFDTVTNLSEDEETGTPSKRQRLASQKVLPLSPSRPLPKNRYGRAARVSSPASGLAEVDFDEVPRSTRTTEPKASRMKTKAGKALPKSKPVSSKKVVEKKKSGTKDRAQKIAESDPDITLVEGQDKKPTVTTVSSVKEKSVTSRRDSARNSAVDMPSKPKPKKQVNNDERLKKSKKAPWETDDFLKQEPPSNDILDAGSSSKVLNVDEKEVALVEQTSDDMMTKVTEFADYEEPVINAPNPPLPKSAPKVTIDLTHEDSPPVVKYAPKIEVPTSPREKRISAYVQDVQQPVQECSETEDLPSPYVPKTHLKYVRSISPQEIRPRPVKVPSIETNHTSSRRVGSRGENKHRLSVNFDLPDDNDRPHNLDRGSKNRKNLSTDHRRGPEPYSRSIPVASHRQKPKQQQQQISRTDLSSPLEKISAILMKINEAVIQNVARRFDEVTETLNEGQRLIIEETIEALEEMFSASDSHVDGLMDLEREYRAACAKIVQGVHDYHKGTEQANRALKNVLSERASRSLCKRFPTKLVPKIPATFLAAQTGR